MVSPKIGHPCRRRAEPAPLRAEPAPPVVILVELRDARRLGGTHLSGSITTAIDRLPEEGILDRLDF